MISRSARKPIFRLHVDYCDRKNVEEEGVTAQGQQGRTTSKAQPEWPSVRQYDGQAKEPNGVYSSERSPSPGRSRWPEGNRRRRLFLSLSLLSPSFSQVLKKAQCMARRSTLSIHTPTILRYYHFMGTTRWISLCHRCSGGYIEPAESCCLEEKRSHTGAQITGREFQAGCVLFPLSIH